MSESESDFEQLELPIMENLEINIFQKLRHKRVYQAQRIGTNGLEKEISYVAVCHNVCLYKSDVVEDKFGVNYACISSTPYSKKKLQEAGNYPIDVCRKGTDLSEFLAQQLTEFNDLMEKYYTIWSAKFI